MDLSEAPGLVLFRVVREGIGISQRLSATALVRLQAIGMLTLEPERLKNQLTTTRKRSPEMEGLFTGDAQAACDFSSECKRLFSPSTIVHGLLGIIHLPRPTYDFKSVRHPKCEK